MEIQGFKTKSLFDTQAHIYCIPYNCYREFKLKTKIDTNITATISSADGSNFGLIGIATCSLLLGVHEFEDIFIA